MGQLTSRMMRASRLEPALYEEVEADPSTLGQAMLVVVIAAVAAGLGSFNQAGLSGLFTRTLGALVGWYLWAALTYFIGTRLLAEPQTRADIGELLRTTGFSSAPGVLRVFAFIPVLGPLVALIASIWMLAAMIVAIRQALDYTSTGRAIGVCLVGWVVMIVITVIFAGLFGHPGGTG